MMFLKNFLLGIVCIVSMTGCSTKEYAKQESLFLLFKTPTLKHADVGFMYENADEMKVEIYSNGDAVMTLTLTKEKICMSRFTCMDKKSFNKKVLSEAYPVDILSHILRGETIFSGLHQHKIRNGFTQNITKTNKYKINYSVLNKQIIFRDTINEIVIKVKRLGS